MSRKSEGARADIYTRITDRIVEDLSRGVRPWMKPWNAGIPAGRVTRPLRHNASHTAGSTCFCSGLKAWREATRHRPG